MDFVSTIHIKQKKYLRFGVFTAVTMKNGVFWDVTQCGSYRSHMA
jgi:hypothetical protein